VTLVFDYNIEAELFPASGGKFRRQRIKYRRFTTAASAIRFVMEEIPTEFLPGTQLEVDEERFDVNGIRQLYESAEYPLVRRAAAPSTQE
jgi:hypothetical protein